MTNSLSLLMGRHGLLCWPSGPFDMPYFVKLCCVGTFGGWAKVNTRGTMGLTMEQQIRQKLKLFVMNVLSEGPLHSHCPRENHGLLG